MRPLAEVRAMASLASVPQWSKDIKSLRSGLELSQFANSERDSTVRRWPCRGGSKANSRLPPLVIWRWAGSRVPRSGGCFGISLGLHRTIFNGCPPRGRRARRGRATCQPRSLFWRLKLLGVKRGPRGGTRCSKISRPKRYGENTRLLPGQRPPSPASLPTTFTY
jgi:hypothetical protein